MTCDIKNYYCAKKNKEIVLATVIVFGFFYLLKKKNKKNNPSPSPVPVPVPIQQGGSMEFNYTNDDPLELYYLRYSNNNNLAIGTQPFTIEWFQFWQAGASFPRIFSIGTFSENNIQIAVSYESGLFYFWNGMTPIDIGNNPEQDEWRHIAVVGNGTSITVYNNGIAQSTFPVNYDIQNDISLDLTIGNETLPDPVANFTGNITNFRWVVGTEVYT